MDLKRKGSLIRKDTAENWWAWIWHFVTQMNMIMMVSLGKIIMWQFHVMKEHFCTTEFKCWAPGFPDVYHFCHTNPSAHLCSLNNNFDRCLVVIEQKFKGIITAAGGGAVFSCPFIKIYLCFLSSMILYKLLKENRN